MRYPKSSKNIQNESLKWGNKKYYFMIPGFKIDFSPFPVLFLILLGSIASSNSDISSSIVIFETFFILRRR